MNKILNRTCGAVLALLLSVVAVAGLESGTYISSLVPTNPTGSDDRAQGDDHIRLVKSTILNTFPNLTGAVTPTHTELNYVDGVTSAIQTQLDDKQSTTSGSLPDARLSSNVPLKNAANTFTATPQTINASGATYYAQDGTTTAFFGIGGGPSGFVGTGSNHPFDFYSNNIARGRISAAGNWVFNTPTSGTAVDVTAASGQYGVVVNGASADAARLALRDGQTGNRTWGLLAGSGSVGQFSLYDYTAGAYRWTVSTTGNHELPAPSSGTTLTINGIASQYAWTSSTGTVTAGLYFDGTSSAQFGTISNHPLVLFANNGSPTLTIGPIATQGVQVGSPTGGDKGSGTLNAAGTIYENNVAVCKENGDSCPVTATGTGASGSWGISVTGNAATATKASVPRRTSGWADGEMLVTSAGVTLNTSDMSAGRTFSILNNSGSAITITQGSGVTLYDTNDGSTGNVTLAARGMATIYNDTGSAAYIAGSIQ